MISSGSLLDKILAAPDEESAALLVEADRARQALSDADPLRQPMDLALARIIVRKLKAGRLVYWT